MKISTLASYIDQPIIINKLQRKIPAILIGLGGAFGVYDFYLHNKKVPEKKMHAVRNSVIIAATIGASLLGTRGLTVGGKKIFSGLIENVPLKEVLAKQTNAVEKFLTENPSTDKDVVEMLMTAKKKQLSLKQIELFKSKIPKNKANKHLYASILSDKEDLTSKEIFNEIGRLSLLGLIPVAGGIAGGVLGDKITHTSTKRRMADKVKEGLYQYLANIFLCNVGAGAALLAYEKLAKNKIIKPTPGKKIVAILAGIVTAGIVSGSYIANFVSKKCINPMFCKQEKTSSNNLKDIYSERKPEALDMLLHVDDIATAGVLAGFKWVEPALPFLYFISGYRAGIGYRSVTGNKG